MQKYLEISIPEPCHENWDAMSPTAQGRFCGSCQKEVVDFSGKTDTEILAFFEKYESPCIRIETHRLDKPLVPLYTYPMPRTPYRWYRPLITAALIATLSVANVYAQGAPIPPKTEQTHPNIKKGDGRIKPTREKECHKSPRVTMGKKLVSPKTVDKKDAAVKIRPKTTGIAKPKRT
jgi:hypothetical protein